ncbi:hypothetical protein ACIBQ0_17005 [Nocardia nova]|uniref:hypothetical protein n=1 Tax=Nocardia nova TaxID=37330 RepID=UPI00378D8B18
MTNPPIVFLDTETTGLHADRRPWEIAMIRREVDETGNLHQPEIVFQVSDVDLTSAELIGLNVGRFYERHHRFKPTQPDDHFVPIENRDPWAPTSPVTAYIGSEAEIAVRVERWTRNAHIVGAVPNFDTETLAAMLRRHGLCPSWHYHLIDVEALAVGWLHGVAARAIDEARMRGEEPDPALVDRNLPLPWKSDDVSGACGVQPPTAEERHTAMGDARWAMRLYDQIAGAAEGEAH